MSEQDEFQEIGPRFRTRKGKMTHHITVGIGTSYLSKLARVAIGNPEHLQVAASPSGRVRLRAEPNPTYLSARLDPGGTVSRLSSYCAEYGFRHKKYDIEVRDGALYFQLERIEQEDAA